MTGDLPCVAMVRVVGLWRYYLEVRGVLSYGAGAGIRTPELKRPADAPSGQGIRLSFHLHRSIDVPLAAIPLDDF